MANYVYKCCKCNHVFETFHRMDFEGPVACPECDSIQTSKVPTAPGIVFDWKNIGAEGIVGSQRYRPPAVPRSIGG